MNPFNLENLLVAVILLFLVVLSLLFNKNRKEEKHLQKYFEENQGIIAGLALFLVVVFSSIDYNLFLSFGAYFFSFILIYYLILKLSYLEELPSQWFFIIFLGYFVFILGLFSFSINIYSTLFEGRFVILIYLEVLAIGYISINSLIAGIKSIIKRAKKQI